MFSVKGGASLALWQVDIEKKVSGEFWTNRYIIEAENIADAQGRLVELVAMEKLFHTALVSFNTGRVRTFAEGDEIYATVPLSGVGALTGDNTDVIPLFNCVRVDFPAQTGRPSRKFYRGCINEASLIGFGLNSALQGVVQNAINPIVTAGFLRDVDGQALIGAVVKAEVAMRQLRRGSKRRTQPVIPPA